MKAINVSGKRKKAIARAVVNQGTGKIRINNQLLDTYNQRMYRLKILEPVFIAGDIANKVDIHIRVNGGGISSQAEVSRLVIAKGLVEYTKDESLKSAFLNYDRNLLVADVRRKAPANPNRHGQARAKGQKSYR